ncbi:hypothetical protein NLU13_0623 [Sarocladium strictum]|uniref:leucine--tRNA ligase n=1 Tax=Sarocladium strictum TaxID=5046 RepID=A0AA39GQ60_SARSR|nr:hypothetical protein NLU13_0623 [Sarocladium strictum]
MAAQVDGAAIPIHTQSEQSKQTLQIQNTDKRDTLIRDEKKYQKEWADAHLFSSDAPTENAADVPKFFATTAYPYMNGTLHTGHSFTISKIEFSTGYARMQGKRALWPQGYHCSGMPIKASADKIAREIEMFGERFEGYKEEDDAPVEARDPKAKTDLGKFGSNKSKAAAKTGGAKYQFQIMLALGIPVEEVPKFSDPQYWLQYFPKLCQADLTDMGCRIDWRRSMVTTDANPFYDSFVSWQVTRLKELGKIKFGKRYTVYSPKDGQPCLDHDRKAGEGIGVQEYTCVKLRTVEWSDRAKEIIGDKLPAGANVFFVPATLRPETMYGQTSCFVGPKVKYGIFQLSAADNEYVVCTYRAARNMAFQSLGTEWGAINQVVEFVGADLIGTLVNAPLSVHGNIRVLPMESLKDSKGTAVVTCVPSDSPDDYATTVELSKKADFYGIKKEWVDREILPIIKTPKGDLIAKTLVEEMKINSPKDAKQLADAKEIAYKNGFYQGVMIHGQFAGKTVPEARDLVAKELMDEKLAFKYAEPDGFVLSRSEDECIAAYLDQWYFNYGTAAKGGDDEWCQTVIKYVQEEFNTYFSEAQNAFENALNWLAQWACSRSYGLGTKLPWDHTQLVESLSDSTIYMAYYTISHLLHGDIFGKTPGLSSKPIKPEQMTGEVWDYIFFRTDTVDSDIAKEDLAAMRREFSYWYPMNLRGSGKDLITNHLSFALYHHVALFPKQFWPRGFRVNGHLMLNGQKMSKSTGNFLTLRQAIEKFGADATRLSLAEAGDGLEDANLEESVANAAILRLFELRKWSKDVLEDESALRKGEIGFFDKIFVNDLNILVEETRQHYEATSYKAAVKSGFYDLQSARDSYRDQCRAAGVGMHVDLVRRFVELQALLIAPVIPHWSEYIWKEVLKKDTSIQGAQFPTAPAADAVLTTIRDYINTTNSNVAQADVRQSKKIAKGKAATFDPKKEKKLTVYVAETYPAAQQKYRDIMQKHWEAEKNTDLKKVMPQVPKPEMKKAMPVLQALKKRLDLGESAERVFEKQLPFKETDVVREMIPGLRSKVLRLEVVEVVKMGEDGKGEVVATGGKDELVAKSAAKVGDVVDGPGGDVTPGDPAFSFVNVEA